MKRITVLLIVLSIAAAATAEEITGEINVSIIDPYDRFVPGFCGSYRPEILQWKGLSLGAGMALYFSGQFKYETTDITDMPDSSNWYELRESYLEIVNFDFFLEGRWQFLGLSDEAHWKAWLSLSGGAIVHSSVKMIHITEFEEDTTISKYLIPRDKHENLYKNEYRTDYYLSPGFLIGIGNFIVGYRHWIYFDESALKKGKPGRTFGTIRLGYRFTW